MIRRATLCLLLCAFPLASNCQFNLGEIENVEFFSHALNKESKMRVYLPPSYNPDNPLKKYPLIISLHGASVGYEVYDFMYPIADALWLTGNIDHFILVMPNGLVPPFNGSFYTNSTLYGNYEDMIAQDIIPYIDSAYHTYGDRKFRAIMGHSMGSYGSFRQILKHPELYCAVAGLSGPLNVVKLDMLLPDVMDENGNPPFTWQYTPGKGLTNLFFTMAGAFTPNPDSENLVDFPIDKNGELIDTILNKWNDHNILEMVRRITPLTDIEIYFDCGSQDEYYLYLHNRALSDSLKFLGIKHEYIEYLGNHTSGLPFRVPVAFKFIDKVFKENQTQLLDPLVVKTVKIFPNPTADLLFFEPETPEQLEWISLRNMNGSLIQNYSASQNPIDLSFLSPGIYTVYFKYPRSTSGYKIIRTK